MIKINIILLAVILGVFTQTKAFGQGQEGDFAGAVNYETAFREVDVYRAKKDQMNNFTADEGETIFKNCCAACHKIGIRLVGPDLADVDQRYPMEWILSFVKSSKTLVNQGDSAAVAIFNEFSQIPMPDQALSDDEIKAVLTYIKREADASEKEAPVLTEQTQAGESAHDTPPAKPFPSFSNWVIWFVLCCMTVMLIAIVILGKMLKRLAIEIIQKTN